MATPRINLSDTDQLFGNDAAEDEVEDVFQAYAVERDEVAAFSDSTRRFCVVRAYKGEGKSALLRLAASRIAAETKDPTLIREQASAFPLADPGEDFASAVREWKRALLKRVANEVGSRIGFAWTDDAMSLVEEAERQGFKEKSLLSAIIERVPLTGKAPLPGLDLELVAKKLGSPDPVATVQRWLKGREPVWLFVDDVDQNFRNTPANKTRVAAFFVACRELTNVVQELKIRAAVRPNVWTIIKMEFEALSHIEQYITGIAWSEDAHRRLLAKRVEGYLRRTRQWDAFAEDLPSDQGERDKALIRLVFQDPVEWGKGGTKRPPHVMLHTLSKHRPRWLVELCKVAAKRASGRVAAVVDRSDVLSELDAFGKRRVEDAIAEFRSQCPEIGELLAAFNREREEYSTDELLDVIKRKILEHLKPVIAGVIGPARPLDVAAFLFEIGFIFGRRDFSDGSYEHISFSERPTLLRARTGVDDGVRWEIHPVFRQALEIRDSTGREAQKQLPGGVIVRKPRQ